VNDLRALPFGRNEANLVLAFSNDEARFGMNLSMRFLFVATLAVVPVALVASPLSAQVVYPAYQTVYRTVYEPEAVSAYRLEYETLVEERQITTQKPVWETETRNRRVTVARPVTETNTQTQRYKVLKPTWETQTQTRRRLVQRPVTETVVQNQNFLTYEPVTTLRTETVDQGGFVDQVVVQPGQVRNRLQWLPGTYAVDPVTGTSTWYRGGFHWVPQQAASSYQVQRQYVPNVVQRQVPQTSYVQKVVTQQTPVTVTKMVGEWVDEPYEVRVQKWTEQLMERPVTTTTQRIEYEARDEPYQVQVCKWIAESQTVKVPRTVAKWVPYTTTRMVPKTVAMNVPVDSCGTVMTNFAPTVSYYSAGPPVAVPATQAANKEATEVGEAPAEAAGEPTESGDATDPMDEQPTGKPAIDSETDPDVEIELTPAFGEDEPA